MLGGRRFEPGEILGLAARHRAVAYVISRVVFRCGAVCCRYSEGQFVTADYEVVAVEEFLVVAHPAELRAEGIAAWSAHFGEAEIHAATTQFARPHVPRAQPLWTPNDRPITSTRLEAVEGWWPKRVPWPSITYRHEHRGRFAAEVNFVRDSAFAAAPLQLGRILVDGDEVAREALDAASYSELAVALQALSDFV